MKVDVSIQQMIRSFSHIMHRYHVIIFTVSVLGGLAVATFLLYQVTTLAQAQVSPPTTATFDKATIERIEQLRGVDDNPQSLNLPSGRTNPFKE